MMRQVLLVPVDPNQVFERAGYPGFLVRLQLGQVYDHIGLNHLPGHEVLMTSGSVCSGQEARIIASYTESIPAIGDRFEKTIATKVEQDETFFQLETLSGYSHSIHKDAGCSSEVADPLESRIDLLQVVSPLREPRNAQELVEIAALQRRVSNKYFRRLGEQDPLDYGANQRYVS